LRRVIPLASSLRCGEAVVNVLSIEDLRQEFVIRLTVLDPRQSRPPADWGNAHLVARDQRATTYAGEVASAMRVQRPPMKSVGVRFEEGAHGRQEIDQGRMESNGGGHVAPRTMEVVFSHESTRLILRPSRHCQALQKAHDRAR
jgi:hypothetical protein